MVDFGWFAMVWYEFVWFSHNSEAEFTTMNIGRGYVINVGRGYVINYKGRHRAARAAKKIIAEISFEVLEVGAYRATRLQVPHILV